MYAILLLICDSVLKDQLRNSKDHENIDINQKVSTYYVLQWQ